MVVRGEFLLWFFLQRRADVLDGLGCRGVGLRARCRVRTGRGGQFTYHGPGQRVAYVMLDLRERGRDVTKFVHDLERWMIGALERFNIRGEVREGRVGVWVERKGPGWAREDKIAAIGVRLRKWVSFHGIAINVEPDLSHFKRGWQCPVLWTAREYASAFAAEGLRLERELDLTAACRPRPEHRIARLMWLNRLVRRLPSEALRQVMDSHFGGLALERLTRRGQMRYTLLVARRPELTVF